MFAENFQCRVRFVSEDKNACVIEADAAVDINKVRAFIAKTRRVFNLTEDADIQVIELRQVVERRNITECIHFLNILDAAIDRPHQIREISEKFDRGEMTVLESCRAVRNLIYWEDEEQAG